MNILLVSDVSIKELLGGAERGLHEEALFLVQKGHKVCVLTRRLPSHTSPDEIINGIHEFRYAVNAQNPLFFLISTLLNAQELYLQLSLDIKFDLINFHQPFSAFAINLLPQTKNIKKAYTCHSLSFEEYLSRGASKNPLGLFLNVNLRKRIEKFNLDQSDKIIVLSQFTKHKLSSTHQINEDKIVIIPSGVNVLDFQPAIDKNAVRQELNIPPKPLILFTARNLVPRMGLENLVKAIPILQQKGALVFLFIAGQGMLKDKLQALILQLRLNDCVTLCGFLPQKKLLLYYQMADFFILPTLELEGFGLVTLEAMACGTPVLATPIGGTIEILSGFNRDFLFNGTTPQAMADLIFDKFIYYKNKPDEYKQLTIDARKFVEKNYSWENNAGNVESLFRKMVI